MKKLVLFSVLPFLVSCASKPVTNVGDIKRGERLYTGVLNVNFNNKKNNETNCEVYLKGSFNPDFKLANDGYILFRTKNREVKIQKLVCPLQVTANNKIWVSHDLDISTIVKPKDPNEISYFGDLTVNWSLTSKDIEALEKGLPRANSERIANLGKFEIITNSDLKNHEVLAKQKIREIQTETHLKLIENTFKPDEKVIQEKKDKADGSDW